MKLGAFCGRRSLRLVLSHQAVRTGPFHPCFFNAKIAMRTRLINREHLHLGWVMFCITLAFAILRTTSMASAEGKNWTRLHRKRSPCLRLEAIAL